MMKSFVRWSTTLGLIGSTALISWIGPTWKVLALSQQQILEKLNSIPVFAIINDQGQPYAVQGDDKKMAIVGYLSQTDAQKTREQIEKQDPKMANKVKVISLPLSDVYKQAKDAAEKKEPPPFSLIPPQQQVQSAIALLRQQDPKVQDFPDIPLFYVTFKKDQKEIVLSFKRGDQVLTPLFFEKESLQQEIDQLKQKEPGLASTATIKVVPLGRIVATLEKEDTPDVRALVLVPSKDSLEFLRKLQQQQQSQQPQNKPQQNQPQAAPKKP
jgi:hypothetical protein